MESFFSSIAQHIAVIFTIITIPIVGIFNHGNKIQSQPVPSVSPIASESAKPSPISTPVVPKIKKSIISTPQPTIAPTNEKDNTPSKSASQLLQQRQSNSDSNSSPQPTTSTMTSIAVTSPNDKDSHCPKIVKIEDSFGNGANTTDGLSFLNGSYLQDVKEITITIYATDPQNLPLYYRYGIGTDRQASPGNLTDNNWVKENKISVDASPVSCSIDPQTGCGTKNIMYEVDNKAGYSCNGLVGYFKYKIIRIPQ
jgi:hypothetical protein